MLQVNNKDDHDMKKGHLRGVASNWSTPRVKGQEGYKSRAKRKGHEIAMSYLESQVEYVTKNWATPNTLDTLDPKSQAALDRESSTVRKGRSQPNNLRDQVAVRDGDRNWPTPTKRDWKGSGPSVERKDGKSRMSHLDYKAELSHFGQTTDPDSLSSPHHQMTTSHGSGSQNTDQIYSLPSQRKLSPKFVEYLMGLPEDWTSLKPIGPNA